MSSNVEVLVLGVVLIVFVFVGFIIWMKSHEKRKLIQMRADLYAKALENGEKLEEGLLEIPKKKGESLKVGILLIFIGIGISLFMYFNTKEESFRAAANGLIPIFMGIGFLVVHYVLKSQGIEDEE